MRQIISFRRVAAAAAFAAVLLMSSCTMGSSKKYGCPNHLQAALSLIK